MSDLEKLLGALNEAVCEYERETRRTLEHQIELEQCVYTLLKNKRPTGEQYKSVKQRLDGIKGHLRNPALYDLSAKRSK